MRNNEAGLPLITLGWELEATNRARKHVPGVECGHDGSVHGQSLEYRIKRELVFTPEKSLAALRMLTTDPYLQVDESCGFHVHVGLGRRTRKLHDWAEAFVQLARDTEAEAFSAVPSSRRENGYCRSWKQSPHSIIANQYSASKGANRDRYNWVNPVEIFRPGGIRTVEIRLMGHTKRYTYLLAWVSVCRMMAMSAWAVAHSITRMEQERIEIKKAWGLVRDNFLQRNIAPEVVARTALYLSSKGGLTEPFSRPLSVISTQEAALQYESRQADEEKAEYTKLVKSMHQAVEEYRARLIASGEAPIGALMPGDTVQCTRVPDDGHMTLGHMYRVISAWEGGCIVLNDDGRNWNVNTRCLRLMQRISREALVCVGS